MKTCLYCHLEKNDEEFAFRNKFKGTRHNMCRLCRKTYFKQHYEENKQYYVDRVVESNNRIRERNRKFILDYLKDKACMDCPESDIVCLDFDHRFDKFKNVSKMISGYSIEKIKKEIEKCEIVCSNCHRKRTARQFGSYKLLL